MSYEENNSHYLYKTSCDNCGSSDANAVYSNGSHYCFSCGHYSPSEETLEVAHRRTTVKEFEPLVGDYTALKARGIHQDTCEKYGYFLASDWNKETERTERCQVANIRDAKGTLIGQKVRFKDKVFKTHGKPQDALFGMHLFTGGKKLVITEGEIDALSVSQVNGNKYPVVSIPTGAGKHIKTIVGKHLEYLDNFEEIILFFDSDDVGTTAAKEVASILPPNKVKLAKLGAYKDANEALVAKDYKAINNAIFTAEAYKPDGLLTIEDIRDEVEKPVEMGLPWFMPSLTKATYGRHYGSVVALGAGTGVGKTDWLTQSVSYDLRELKEKVGVFFLEQAPVETVKRVAGKHNGRQFHIPNDDAEFQKQLNEELKDDLSSDDYRNLYLYDSFGVTDWDSIKSKIIYLTTIGVRIFYIDHLTALATGTEDKDEKSELERITAEMAGLCKKYNVWMLTVSHLSTPATGSHEEGARVQIRQFKGSRAIGFWMYFMFALERNQQADNEEERHTTTFRILKDRNTGQSTGQTIALGYDQDTGLIYEKEGMEPVGAGKDF